MNLDLHRLKIYCLKKLLKIDHSLTNSLNLRHLMVTLPYHSKLDYATLPFLFYSSVWIQSVAE